MVENESAAGRALLALFLMIGFYILVFAVVAALVLLPLLAFTKSSFLGLKLGIPFWILAYVIVRAALPKFGQYDTPGVELTVEQQPELFSVLREVARKVGQPMPSRIYLVPDANACVYEKGGFFGLFSTRVLCLGYPLFPVFNVSELKSIVAHEFGHYAGGDTALGPWIHASRSAAMETAYQLEASGAWLSPLFVGYAKFYLRITQAISRRQEYVADRIAGQVVGSAAAISALKQAIQVHLSWVSFWGSELVGIFRRSHFPEVTSGFSQFHQQIWSDEESKEKIEKMLQQERSEAYDSHPATLERIRRLETLNLQVQEMNPRQAVTLLRDVPNLEREIAVFATEDIAVFNFPAIEWQQVRDAVTIPNFTEDLLSWPQLVENLTPAKLPAGKTAFDIMVENTPRPHDFKKGFHQLDSIAVYTLSVALTLRLLQEGWEMHDAVGRPVAMTKGDDALVPAIVVQRLINEAKYRDEWKLICEKLGIGNLLFSDINCLRERQPQFLSVR